MENQHKDIREATGNVSANRIRQQINSRKRYLKLEKATINRIRQQKNNRKTRKAMQIEHSNKQNQTA